MELELPVRTLQAGELLPQSELPAFQLFIQPPDLGSVTTALATLEPAPTLSTFELETQPCGVQSASYEVQDVNYLVKSTSFDLGTESFELIGGKGVGAVCSGAGEDVVLSQLEQLEQYRPDQEEQPVTRRQSVIRVSGRQPALPPYY